MYEPGEISHRCPKLYIDSLATKEASIPGNVSLSNGQESVTTYKCTSWHDETLKSSVTRMTNTADTGSATTQHGIGTHAGG